MTNSYEPVVTSIPLNQLYKAFECIRIESGEREMPGQLLASFLYIASHDGCYLRDLQIDLGLTSSTASRNTQWLSEKHRLGKDGLGWVERVHDTEENYKFLKLSLTEKGKELIKKVTETYETELSTCEPPTWEERLESILEDIDYKDLTDREFQERLDQEWTRYSLDE